MNTELFPKSFKKSEKVIHLLFHCTRGATLREISTPSKRSSRTRHGTIIYFLRKSSWHLRC